MVNDILALACDRGAAAAVLYSLTARSCGLYSEDVLNSKNHQTSLVQQTYRALVGLNLNLAVKAPASTLSVSVPQSTTDAAPSLFGKSSNNTRFCCAIPHGSACKSVVTNSNSFGARKSNPSKSSKSTPVYLIATLANGSVINHNSNNNNNNNNGGGNANTGLAMIILNAITGCTTLIPCARGCLPNPDEMDGKDTNLGHQTRLSSLVVQSYLWDPEELQKRKIGSVDEESSMMQDRGQRCVLTKNPVKIESTRTRTGDDTAVLETECYTNRCLRVILVMRIDFTSNLIIIHQSGNNIYPFSEFIDTDPESSQTNPTCNQPVHYSSFN
ncbi:uncharacterized protein MELLADRAFT_104047 [Melampsora larici-populina 98AG31]|uniref:Uncharacterized protein n=1 Tax=Melampsora larici-populina (strain 98AG31 / pathotype 3-4-7) TaxID=747676 RepID=F4RDD6_MELLP|nr:uncharacterized protein MELLADRAFT_104047 [Melampsora larici-populina 98AG31]EGG09384.1 hypothetical protein MELLADRAFT_104047 [Melampsora larici-populina 98AG31]